MSVRALALIALCFTALACSGGQRSTQPSTRNMIVREQIAATGAADAYAVLQQLRPDFLRGRPAPSGDDIVTQTPVVYLDDTRLGDVGQLRTIPASMISTIRLISARDATTRWGTGHPAGAIEVRTGS